MPLTELQIKNVKPQPGKIVRLFDARGPTLKSLKQAEDGGV
jgi:hypothetical protein